MRHLVIIVSLPIFLSAHVSQSTKFAPTELMVIQWGDEAHQLKIEEPFYLDTCGTPGDISDDLIDEFGSGPTRSFVDINENVYISSYDFGHFKVFNNHGTLILDLSRGSAGYNSEFFSGSPCGFAADSNLLIYMINHPSLTYVPVIDLSGKLVDKLYPCGESDPVKVDNIYYHYDNVMAFSCGDRGYRTYIDGHFIPSGGSYRGRDGNYYTARQMDSSIVEFKKYGNPDSTGWGQWREVKNVDMGEEISMAGFLGVDDNMLLYIIFVNNNNIMKIRTYTTDYIKIDEFILPRVTNKYYMDMAPFLRPDGNVYEFRCLDDGLHVIRWSRQ